MNMKLLVAALSMLAMNAHADDSRVEKRVRATGSVQNVAGTVSQCSPPIPFTFDRTTATVSSNTRYLVCKEYEAYEAQVTGSSWNTSESQIAGSAQRFYKLEWAEAGGSRFLSGDFYQKKGQTHQHSITSTDYALAITGVLLQCSQAQNMVASTSIPLQQTKCAGQNLSIQQ